MVAHVDADTAQFDSCRPEVPCGKSGGTVVIHIVGNKAAETHVGHVFCVIEEHPGGTVSFFDHPGGADRCLVIAFDKVIFLRQGQDFAEIRVKPFRSVVETGIQDLPDAAPRRRLTGGRIFFPVSVIKAFDFSGCERMIPEPQIVEKHIAVSKGLSCAGSIVADDTHKERFFRSRQFGSAFGRGKKFAVDVHLVGTFVKNRRQLVPFVRSRQAVAVADPAFDMPALGVKFTACGKEKSTVPVDAPGENGIVAPALFAEDPRRNRKLFRQRGNARNGDIRDRRQPQRFPFHQQRDPAALEKRFPRSQLYLAAGISKIKVKNFSSGKCSHTCKRCTAYS